MLRWFHRTLDRIVMRDRQYRFLFRQDDSGEVVSLDCETTGFDPWIDDIISIAAIRICGARIRASQSFRAVVRPEAAMRPSAVKVHQLRAQDVAEGRPIFEVLPELLHFIGSRPVVGYWIAFDVSMLNKYLIEMLNIHLPNPQIDVSELYYERKYGNAPPGTAIDLRYQSIVADLGLRGG
jgi:DNA polymerase III subunit epsilon